MKIMIASAAEWIGFSLADQAFFWRPPCGFYF